MDKLSIVQEKQSFNQWVRSLKNVSKHVWPKQTPADAKSVPYLIDRLNKLDQFIVTYRMPYLLKNQPMPNVVFDPSPLDEKARDTAWTRMSRAELIDFFITVRQRFLALLVMLPEHRFHEPFPMDSSKTISDYFTELIKHDYDHKKEIEKILNES
ncbi:DinB family protein [Bacillus sp. 1P06AnD]|uniref:DinB family protein n=1 Tax=Bacillus sp. 1P06AnD TaxID=3132208 RepID=UPI00399FBD08